ncbi:MAG TPA: hypothetical protein VE643_08210 [Nitrososphaeraceae archaeon]|nr:hypothetical protein [Nitrososphaeraceae archaeon]
MKLFLKNPFYKPTNYGRQVLSENRIAVLRMCSGMKKKALIVADSLKEYRGNNLICILKSLVNSARIGKNGISVWPP